MLNSITWQEFLFLSGLLTGIYYAIVLFILRRARKNSSLILSKSEEPETGVMGGINEDNSQNNNSSIAPEEISFAETTQQTSPHEQPVDSLILGSVSDLLEEAKRLTDFIIENKSTREEATTFLTTLLSKYSQLKESKYQNAIELYLLNELKDQDDQKFSLDEIRSLWK